MIACEALRPELDLLNEGFEPRVKILYLKQGLHDFPDQLREEVQSLIDQIEDEYSPETILMAYGFCGRGLYGLKAKKAILVIPKVHDCIPLLLGDGPDKDIRAEEYSKTYWLSAGWLKYSQVEHITKREERYQEYVALYGKDSADYLLEVELSWRNNYEEVTLIYWDELYDEQLLKDADYVAKDMQLPYKKRRGTSWYLKELMEGGQDMKKFFHIAPNYVLEINAHGLLEITSLEQV